MTNKFHVGDLVWAKMKGYPYWPGRIKSLDEYKAKLKKLHQHVYFFGTHDSSLIPDDMIEFHSEDMIKQCPVKRHQDLQAAVDEIIAAAEEAVWVSPPAREENASSMDTERRSRSPTPRIGLLAEGDASGVDAEGEIELRNMPSTSRIDDIETTIDPMPSGSEVAKSPTHVAAYIPDDEDGDEVVPIRTYARPSDKKIGFLGLGMMGQGIVKNLLDSGHHLTVWNRTHEKCDVFTKMGAIKAESVAAVVQASDIIFCCVSDSNAVKSIVFGPTGVLKALEGSEVGEKGYVEMTTVEPEISTEICEAITKRGGKYLETPLIGTCKDAYDGQLLILGSGDVTLFEACEPCFHAITMHSYYISCIVGQSAKFNLIVKSFYGSAYCAMAEALALADRCKVERRDLGIVLQNRGYDMDSMVLKAEAMVRSDFTTDIPLGHQQTIMNMGIELSDDKQQPIHTMAAACELYKYAMILGHEESDVASVCVGLRKEP